MARTYYSKGIGRVDVFPFKKKDFLELCRYCLEKRDKFSVNKKSFSYYMWYRNYVILILGVNTGIRIETMLQLKPIEMRGGRIAYIEQKTRRKKKYDLSDSVSKIVQDYIEEFSISDHEYMFHSRKSNVLPMTRQNTYLMLNKLAKEIGVNYAVGCHSLRKSYGRFYYDETNDLLLTQALLDHTNPLYTLRYICLENKEVTNAKKGLSWGL